MPKAKESGHYRDLLNYVELELQRRLKNQVPLEPPMATRLSRHLKHFPIAPWVSVQPADKSGYHSLSLTAGDRPGLLYRIARIFVAHNVQLRSAKITTLGERAEDTFMISGPCLEDPEETRRFEADLIAELRT
jgi:[protein-PII] uridylyltransferase